MPRKKTPALKRVPKQRSKRLTSTRSWLEKQSKDELVDFILGLAQEHPRISELLADRSNLKQGNISPIREAIRRDIEALEPDWQDYDAFDADTDFAHIAERLAALLDAGYADDVIELGEAFLQLAPKRYEYSHYDDWGISSGIAECLDIILKALTRSSFPPTEQLLWYIDAELKDDYAIFHNTEDFIKKRSYKKADWQAVSEILESRLQAQMVPENNDTSSDCYKRENLSRWLQTAMERSGRQTDIVGLLQREAPITHRYDKLVSALLTADREQEAHDWIVEGFAKTIDKLPGIAWRLAEQLRDMASRKKQHANIASLLALEFFYRPDTALYCKLEKVTQRIRCWPAVREALLAYLETGVSPDLQPAKKHNTKALSLNWPLPPCDLLLPKSKRTTNPIPNTGVLVNIAIYEKRPDDVLKWYHPGRKSYMHHNMDDSVAEAVKSTHPDEALAIWKRVAEWEIARVKPAAYKVAAPYLKKIRALYQEQKRTGEWNTYLTALRQQHKAKRRLIETLNSL
jgi:uncharacterized Zn finger protein